MGFLAKALAYESAPSFTDGSGPNSPILLGLAASAAIEAPARKGANSAGAWPAARN